MPFQIALIFQLEYIDLPLSNSVAVLIFVATMSKNNFNFQYVIGRGGFGKVSITSLPNKIITQLTWIGVESRVQEDHADFCNERDV